VPWTPLGKRNLFIVVADGRAAPDRSDEFLVSQVDLAAHAVQRRPLALASPDKPPVLLCRQAAHSPELVQRPIDLEPLGARSPAAGCAVVAPLPIARVAHRSGPNRIQNDEAVKLHQMSFLLNEDRLVAALEEVPAARVQTVVFLCVPA